MQFTQHQLLSVIPVVLGSFIVRALPRILLKNVYVSDTYFHLYCASVIRESKFRIPKKFPRVLLPHRHTYPYLYHFLLALFPLPQRLWMERLSGAIFDTLSLIVIYIFSSWAVRASGHSVSNLPLVVAVLFAFAPSFLRTGSGPRAYNGSPRTFGLFLYLTHISSAWIAFQNQNIWLFLLSLVSGACIFFSAKFATQVLLLFGVFFSIFVSPYYFLVLVGSLFLAILLTGGRVLMVLEGHFQFSLYYYKHLQKIFLYPNLRNYGFPYFQKWLSLIRYIRYPLSRGNSFKEFIKEFISWFYTENRPMHLFVTVFPQYLLAVYYGFLYVSFDSLERFLLVWMAAGLFYFIFTKIKLFMFLGEGERYLEFALFPSLYLLCDAFGASSVVVAVLLLYSSLSAIYYIQSYLDRNKNGNDLDYFSRKMIFKTYIKDVRDVIMPIGSFHWLSLLFSNNPVLTYGVNMRFSERSVLLKVFGNYPYPSKNYREIFAQYHVRYVVSGEAWVKKYREEIIEDAQDFDSLIEWVHTSPLFWIGRVKETIDQYHR